MSNDTASNRAPLRAHIVVSDASRAIELYRKAFGAEELFRMTWPDSDVIVHAEILVNGATVMMAQENLDWGAKAPGTLGGSPVTMHLYLESPAAVDAMAEQASAAGCKIEMPPEDAFWGDRYAKRSDPFGHSWAFSAHQRDVTPEEMASAMRAMAEQSA